jgi:hypothetical protein
MGMATSTAMLHELGLEDGVGVKNSAHQGHEEATDGKVFEAEKLEIDERTFLAPLPDAEGDHAEDKEEGEEADEARGEPVVLLAFVEHDLQAAHGYCEKREADIIHIAQARGVCFDPRRIFDEACNQKKGHYADRNVDEEDPAPGKVVGDPAAQCWTDGWREHGDKAVEGEGLAALVRLE